MSDGVKSPVEYHECPGLVCGRDDVPETSLACPDCLDRLPSSLRVPLDRMTRNGAPLREFLPIIARCKIWFENRQVGS